MMRTNYDPHADAANALYEHLLEEIDLLKAEIAELVTRIDRVTSANEQLRERLREHEDAQSRMAYELYELRALLADQPRETVQRKPQRRTWWRRLIEAFS